MMAEFSWKSAVVAVIVLGLNNQINLVRAGKCDLEKTFRTPRDMSRVNFDHFEIVEKDGFDKEPSTTTTEATTTETPTKTNGDTVAKAQVLLRFGGDDTYGSNHIMKIPPQCRNVASHVQPHYPNPYYQHPYPPSYYHPYPPPVPYTFPNYYFCNYAQASQNLPRPLKEYFRTHGQFSVEEEVFIRGRPAGEDGHYTDFVDANRQSKNSANKNLADVTKIGQVAAALFTRPKILEPLELTEEDIDQMMTENTKIDACAAEIEAGNRNNTIMEHNHIIDASEKSKKYHKHEKEDKKDENDELKGWLRTALVSYGKCTNCTESPEMLARYPITKQDCQLKPILYSDSCPYCNKNKDDCKCLQCQCNKKDKKFNTDHVDIIVAEIIDPYDKLLKTSEKDQKSLIYNLAKIGLDLADVDSSSVLQAPPKISLDLELDNKKNAAGSSSTNSYRYPQPKISNCDYSISSGCRHTSNPCAATYYQAPTNVETSDDADVGYNRYPVSGSYYASRNPSTNYCGCCNSYSSPSVNHNCHSTATASPSKCYYFLEPNVYIKKQPEPHIPKLLKVVPRPNLEILPNNAPRADITKHLKSHFCSKCGHKHSGNNFCDNCGHPVAFYSTTSGGNSCPTCPSDW